jgi:hypothetical protein
MKRSWPNLKYYLGIRLTALRKATKHLSQDTRSLVRDLNPVTPENETGVLTIWPWRPIKLNENSDVAEKEDVSI